MKATEEMKEQENLREGARELYHARYTENLFQYLMNLPDINQYALSLYNALNDTNESNPNDIHIQVIQDAVCLTMNHSASILSFGMDAKEKDDYSKTSIPMKFIVYANEATRLSILNQTPLHAIKCFYLYLGTENQEERHMLKAPDTTGFEVTMVNVCNNQKILESCRLLNDYTSFVSSVRQKIQEGVDIDSSVDESMSTIRKDSIIQSFVRENAKVIKNLVLYEYEPLSAIEQMLKDK